MLAYNLCYIREGDRLLMLNRNKAPLCGLWHGVGGKLEPGETPYASVLREVYEETGLRINAAHFAGTVTWEEDGGQINGVYVYTASLPDSAKETAFVIPQEREEGILAWKPIAWVIRPDNRGVAEHVRHFLPQMLDGTGCFDYRCSFLDGKLLGCERQPLDESNANSIGAAPALWTKAE
ncbi:MAG: mismatch repair protein MutT [Paenibacillus sp.]|jgi:8-oxo-dGTP diphosphatase|nr:mismatch repair protein MutT [Paenibacillus sp.]